MISAERYGAYVLLVQVISFTDVGSNWSCGSDDVDLAGTTGPSRKIPDRGPRARSVIELENCILAER